VPEYVLAQLADRDSVDLPDLGTGDLDVKRVLGDRLVELLLD
jgi:hypothetical protein